MDFFTLPMAKRFYADIKLLLEKLSDYRRLKKKFYHKVGYELNLAHPQSYNQKINWKKIYDRNPLLTTTADKLAARKFAEDSLEIDEARRILIPLLYAGDNANKIPWRNLPDKFVVKANHGCRMHLIVNGDKYERKEEIIQTANKWLQTSHGLFHYEWAYRNIKPQIMIEELLETANGSLPRDYKCYCFNGQCKLIRVSENRFGLNELSAYFDQHWNLLPVHNPGYPSADNFDKPDNLLQMISLAERLSVRFDSVRVDLYNVDGKLYFGEFTHYDASGFARFEPESFDFELGAHWQITPGYWKKEIAVKAQLNTYLPV